MCHSSCNAGQILKQLRWRRLEVLVQCNAGTYQLQSGQGQFSTQDPGCGSSHCDLIQQPIIATINVVSAASSFSPSQLEMGVKLPPIVSSFREVFLAGVSTGHVIE